MFETIIFDCDGVLVDSEILAIRGERRALYEFGLNYEPEDYIRSFLGLHDEAYFDALRNDYKTVKGNDAPENFEAKILESRNKDLLDLKAIAGAASILRACPSVAVASSSGAQLLNSKLKSVGLWDFVEPHVYSADLVEHGKPAPDIFLYAAERVGVAPENCLVMEDSVNGVIAGVAAGMTVWGFTGGSHCFEGHSERLLEAGASAVAENFDTFIKKL